MRIRFAWIAAVVALISLGLLVACSTKYSSSSNGLVVVPSQGSLVMQTFSLDLSNGGTSAINNVNGPITPGVPASVILDPAGTHAYVILYETSAQAGTTTGIEVYPVASDGKLGSGTTTTLNTTTTNVNVNCVTSSGTQVLSVGVTPTSVSPVFMAMDSPGKYLFVADSATTGTTVPYQCNGMTVTSTVAVPGTVSVLSVSNGSLTEIAGSPFALPSPTVGGQTPSASALAVSATIFPPQYAACSVVNPPATENLYVTDSNNNLLFNYSISSTGSISPVLTGLYPVPTGTLPSGVAVDPCNRFVYVANTNSNNVSAYTICTVITSTCTAPDYSLTPVAGSPFPVGDLPGPISEDAYGKFLYVVNTGSSQVSEFRIGPADGALTAIGNPLATNLGANSIAVRKDDSYLFVANINSANVSQYAITPATGNLTLQTAIQTFNLPSGVAVK